MRIDTDYSLIKWSATFFKLIYYRRLQDADSDILDSTPVSVIRRYKMRKLLALSIGLAIVLHAVAGAAGGKIPFTTTSDKALAQFMKGLELQEKLRFQESRQYFQKAVQEDPDFAIAHLYLAQVAPTAKDLFKSLARAKDLASVVSQGERDWILGFVATAVDGNPMKQREHYMNLVAAYPNDERAHNLLGNHYFGQQDYERAIEEFERAVKINPEYSQPYNQLGYAHRFLGQFDDAEKAFQRYIELIPDDPNPYDSYAELLLKMGRFDEAISKYRKALEINPKFTFSHVGIASCLCYKGRLDSALAELKKMYDNAADVGVRRTALFNMAVAHIDAGDIDAALSNVKKMYELAADIGDTSSMAGDLNIMGSILRESGKYDKALAKYAEALNISRESSLAAGVKQQAQLTYLNNSTRALVMKGDLADAKKGAKEFRTKVEAAQNQFQIRLAYELESMIAIAEKSYDTAIAKLQKTSQLNPYNLYRLAQAYEGKGKTEKAKELYAAVAGFNGLNNLIYATIRGKAMDRYAAL
jgi:tetratricopeptide (TPR) repeat protein